jgi:hypothetical protein
LTINDKATFSFNSSDFVLGHQLYYDGAGNDRWERLTGNAGSAIYQTAGNILFYRTAAGGATGDAVTPSESMRINSNGDIEMSGDGTSNDVGSFILNVGNPSNDSYRPISTHVASTGERTAISFYNPNGQVGYIATTSSSTAYNTSSDYRLKENVVTDWDATTRLKQLKPSRFNFIADSTNTTVDGFLAHEVEDIVPEAITGTKDATEELTNVVINNVGNVIARDIEEDDWIAGKEDETYPSDSTWEASHTANVYQGIDQAKLVPLLTKALQEALTKIEQLESRIETLEG